MKKKLSLQLHPSHTPQLNIDHIGIRISKSKRVCCIGPMVVRLYLRASNAASVTLGLWKVSLVDVDGLDVSGRVLGRRAVAPVGVTIAPHVQDRIGCFGGHVIRQTSLLFAIDVEDGSISGPL